MRMEVWQRRSRTVGMVVVRLTRVPKSGLVVSCPCQVERSRVNGWTPPSSKNERMTEYVRRSASTMPGRFAAIRHDSFSPFPSSITSLRPASRETSITRNEHHAKRASRETSITRNEHHANELGTAARGGHNHCGNESHEWNEHNGDHESPFQLECALND